MTPHLTLILSFDGLRLLRRVTGGWQSVGAVAADTPALAQDMTNLRKQSGTDDHSVRLVLPAEQIRFMTLPHDHSTQSHVFQALEGATPYDVDDLVCDYETDAAGTHVAAIARETLNEAADFARTHGFDPVAFTALPPDGSFGREIVFDSPDYEAEDPPLPFLTHDPGETPPPVAVPETKPKPEPADIPAPKPESAEPPTPKKQLVAARKTPPAAQPEPTRKSRRVSPLVILLGLLIVGMLGAALWFGGGDPAPEKQGAMTPATPQPTPVLSVPVLSVDEARRVYDKTGVWLRAPRLTAGQHSVSPSPLVMIAPALAAPRPNIPVLSTKNQLTDTNFAPPPAPPSRDIVFDLDENGFVRATAQGAATPTGVIVYQGRPAIVPPVRPNTPPAPAEPPEDAPEPIDKAEAEPAAPPATISPGGVSLAGLRPLARPEQPEKPAPYPVVSVWDGIRPLSRPTGASAEELEHEPPEPLATAALIPHNRPRDLNTSGPKITAAPVAPRTTKPSGRTNNTVAKRATIDNAINLSKVNLLGVTGSPNKRRALVRLSNGRVVTVGIGDRLDGGRVSSIGESSLKYKKSGRNVTLQMPRG